MIRLWFCIPRNEDELQEAISSLRTLSEELLLEKIDMIIELSVPKRTPPNKEE